MGHRTESCQARKRQVVGRERRKGGRTAHAQSRTGTGTESRLLHHSEGRRGGGGYGMRLPGASTEPVAQSRSRPHAMRAHCGSTEGARKVLTVARRRLRGGEGLGLRRQSVTCGRSCEPPYASG